MKRIFTLAILWLVGSSLPLTAEAKTHLFILSGQSNMERMNPEISFSPDIKKGLSQDDVVIVKDAMGGQPICRWFKKWKAVNGQAVKNPGELGDLYDRLMGKVKKAMEGKKFDTVTFVWMQGEADKKSDRAGVYEESLKGLVKQLQDDLGREDVNVVIGRISDYGMDKGSPIPTIIREAQVKACEGNPRWAWVDCDDLNGPTNDLHYTPEGYKLLGSRFAQKAIELIGKNSK